MKPVLILLILFSFALKSEVYQPEVFCQDVNVILQRIQAYADNIANAHTTRTVKGGPYQEKVVKSCKKGECTIVRSQEPPILKYEPEHQDANEDGYVAYPNLNVMDQMAKMMKAQNVYETLIKANPLTPEELLVSDKFKICFKKFKEFRESFDFKTYLGR